MRILFGLIALWASEAVAGEGGTWQGRLVDGNGTPIDGSVSVTLELFDAASSGNSRGTTSLSVDAQGGYVSIALPAAFTAAAGSWSDTWLEVRVGSNTMGPRQQLASVPSAVRASRVVVEGAAGGCTAAEEGQIRWDTTLSTLRVCVSSNWRVVSAGAGSGPGSVQANPVSSCADVASSGVGAYWVDYGTGAVQVTCDPAGGWTYVVEYHDSNTTDDLPDSAAGISTGFNRTNARYIGNNALNALPFEQAEWCIGNGTTTSCFPITDADWSLIVGDVDSLIGPKRRVIAALSGQVDDGRTEGSVNGEFYASRTGVAPPICPGPGYGSLNANNGFIAQWGGDDADWHTFGNGLSLYRNGSNTYGVNNEIAWGAENLSPNTFCGPEWEHFTIRVRHQTPGTVGQNRLSAAANCAAVSTALGPVDGFYWIDPDGGSRSNAGRVYCDFTNNWTHVVHYLDDNTKNDIPNTRYVISGGFTTSNASYVGNDALNALSISTAEWCISNLTTTSCFPITDAAWTYTGTDVNALTGNKRRVIAALSGQVDDGRTESSANGDLYATRTGVAPPICAGPGYGSLNASNGYIAQWPGNDADWHTWGNGLSFYKNGSDVYGIHNELAWGAENLSPNTFCGPEWELFFIRVR